MTLGVFDSGIGGLTIQRELATRFPNFDITYLADQASGSYAEKPVEEIIALTTMGCERLFNEGCTLVVLACNTATAAALRPVQQRWLPVFRAQTGRAVNILGLIIPTVENAAQGCSKGSALALFGTPRTVDSAVYAIEMQKIRPDVMLYQEACPDLSALIERAAGESELAWVIQKHVDRVTESIGYVPERAILACTHYEIVADLFARILPDKTQLFHQPSAVAHALDLYLARHPEYLIAQNGTRRYLTTGSPRDISGIVGGGATLEAISA